MNITELARQLKVSTQLLREELPKLGFDIGLRAIKIDPKVAEKVIKLWSEKKQSKVVNKYVVIEKKLGEVAEPVKVKEVVIPKLISIRNFAELLKMPVANLIGELFKNGVMASMNESIDFETASIIAEDLGYKTKAEEQKDVDAKIEAEQAEDLDSLIKEDETNLIPRPPVVVVMGHVDHGKTKLLDAIRETNVIDSESGGITQHIGAYQAETNGKLITFLDTPGHEAFAAMRSRGGRLADVAIIVVAADDGIKPQTLEAIEIAQREKLPFLIAINKVDKPEADIERVKKGLAELNLLPEDWGGKTICVPISAKQKTGIDNLLEMVLLLADLEKVSANPNRQAVGTIIESHVDKGEGPVATALVQAGTLKVGDFLMAGKSAGKVKAMKNFVGQNIKIATPSTPVKILGLKVTPVVGDIFKVIDEKEAKKMLKKVTAYERSSHSSAFTETSMVSDNSAATLPVVLKTDVLGSRGAIIEALTKLGGKDFKVNIIKSGLGNINEQDIIHAEAVKGSVFGFHVQVLPQAKIIAGDKNVFVQNYEIIYELIDEVKKQLEAKLKPELIRTQVGKGRVLAIFRAGKKDTIIGVRILEGSVKPKVKIKILRGEEIIGEAELEEIRLGKEMVGEVAAGGECGLKLKGAFTILQGDIVEMYKEEIQARHVA